MADKLYQIYKFWSSENKPFHGILISVYYNKIVAKTNRISGLFKGNQSNYAIVGAKFNTKKTKHIITYFLSLDDLIRSMELIYKVDNVLSNKFKDGIDRISFYNKNIINKIDFKKYSLTKSLFKQIIADVSYIENFEVEKATQPFKESIITLYNTGIDTKQLFQNIGIDLLSSRILDNNTVLLDENQSKVLFAKARYLVSMATENISNLSPEDFIVDYQQDIANIPSPSIEPTIGVIDTLFDNCVYFSEWVEYHDLVDDNIPKSSSEYRHGTAVSSIIVDGHNLNP